MPHASRVALITGCGKPVGIGNSTARALAAAGVTVVVSDVSPAGVANEHNVQGDMDTNWGGVDSLVEAIVKAGGIASATLGDVSKEADAARMVAEVLRRHGRLDILVNNVGITGPRGNAIEVDVAAWDSAMRVNVASMMLMAKYAIPEMIKSGGGSIINLSSVAGLQGGHPSLLYPTSKGAIVALTRAMAAHHGRDGIRVNCIAPGTVYTPMVASRGMTPELRKARSERTLLGTEGTGWDIGYGALYLASDESRWVTGITLPIDGGATAGSKASPVPPSEPERG